MLNEKKLVSILRKKLNDHIDQEIEREHQRKTKEIIKRASEPPYFRCSEAGDCRRQLYYAMTGVIPSKIDRKTFLLLRDGIYNHQNFQALVKDCWKLAKVEETISTSFRYRTQVIRLQGHSDGLPFNKVVMELKGINHFIWMKAAKSGEIYPAHTLQLCCYRILWKKKFGVVILKNKNTTDLHMIATRQDQEMVDYLMEKFYRILLAIKSHVIPKREFEEDSMECRRCGYHKICWRKE